jgi:hypothetical protein
MTLANHIKRGGTVMRFDRKTARAMLRKWVYPDAAQASKQGKLLRHFPKIRCKSTATSKHGANLPTLQTRQSST